KATVCFPKSEMFGLTAQMRRGGVSVAANIVEGATRQYQKEYVQFLHTAMGSLAELGYYIGLSQRIGYLAESDAGAWRALQERTAKTLGALMNCVEQSKV
ncbi:four helix bundle protein, partial [Candidatus Sumerlaeota bacterium]|nr:four helix bundle protein [Candidatus Sumerlaeota bacterium]